MLASYWIPAVAQAYSAGTVDGKPDLNGIWQTMNAANWDLQGHEARAGAEGQRRGGRSLGAKPGGRRDRPAAAAQKKKNFENRANADPEVKCFLPGVPRATYMPYPFQIFQNPNYIAIAYEYDSAYRNIFLKDPGPAPVDSWMGQSVGHWEGDTLVVDVTGLVEDSWFDRAGIFTVTHCMSWNGILPMAPNVMNYEATIEDSRHFRDLGK